MIYCDMHIGIEMLIEESAKNKSFAVNSRMDESKTCGFVYIVQRGYGILITSAIQLYHVGLAHVLSSNLRTGDHIEVTVADKNVTAILSVSHCTINDAPALRPAVPATFAKVNFKFGGRVLIETRHHNDFTETIATQNFTNTHNIAILIDQGDDCTKFLTSHGIHEVYIASIDMDMQKKVFFVLNAMLCAKHAASKGENVVVFVDNLNKLFRLYNCTTLETDELSMNKIAIGPFIDLKNFIMSARATTAGSITFITTMHEPKTEMENYALDELSELFNTHSTSQSHE